MIKELVKKQKISVKPYNTKELASIYGISAKTLRRWLEPFNEKISDKKGKYYTVKQVEIIFEKLGVPYEIEV